MVAGLRGRFLKACRMSSTESDPEAANQRGKLKRSLGLIDVLMFGVGGIVGAGIYAIVGEAAGFAGHMLWASFAVAAVVALLTGLSYAEFVSRYPDAGGSFEYIKRSFGRKTALSMSLLMLFTNVIAPAAIAISFSDYLGRLIEVPGWSSAIGIIVLMGIINAAGIQNASWFNTFATVITLLGLLAVVGFAVPHWGEAKLLTWPDEGAGAILSGGALIFFSYVGFEDLVKMAEETREPHKVMPRGIVVSGLIVLVVYLLIAISVVAVLPPQDLAESSGPLAAVLGEIAGPAWVTGLIVVALFATSKTILSNLLGSSRLVYDVARDSGFSWLQKLTKVNHKTGTPLFAVAAITIIVILFSLIGNLKIVASLSNIFVFLLFLSVNVALIRCRSIEEERAPFHIPFSVGSVPIPTALAIAGLLTLLGFNVMNLLSS